MVIEQADKPRLINVNQASFTVPLINEEQSITPRDWKFGVFPSSAYRSNHKDKCPCHKAGLLEDRGY
jgi:hypothetical protein